MNEDLPIQRWTKIFTRYPASEVLPSENGEYVTYADHVAQIKQILASLMYSENVGDNRYLMDRVRKKVGLLRLEGDYENGWSEADLRSVGLIWSGFSHE